MPLAYTAATTANGATTGFVHKGGQLDVDVFGTFDGATVKIERNTVDATVAGATSSNYVPLENGTWTEALGKALDSGKCLLRFNVSSAGGSTSLYMSINRS